MKTFAAACAVLAATLIAPNELRAETFPYDHMHLAVPDQAKAVEWYVTNLGAKRGDAPDRVVFGRTIFAFLKSEMARPSAGSAIDHVGFSVPNVEAKMKELEAAGAKGLPPPPDLRVVFNVGATLGPAA